MALKAAPLNASSAPTHTSSQEHRAPWHPQDIDGLGGASSDDNDAGSHTTGTKHKKASAPAPPRAKKSRAASSEIDLVDTATKEPTVEDIDNVVCIQHSYACYYLLT